MDIAGSMARKRSKFAPHNCFVDGQSTSPVPAPQCSIEPDQMRRVHVLLSGRLGVVLIGATHGLAADLRTTQQFVKQAHPFLRTQATMRAPPPKGNAR